eukprot:164924_1
MISPTKGFGGMEVIEMAGLIMMLIFVGELDPTVAKKAEAMDVSLFLALLGVPIFSYCTWIYIMVGYHYYGEYLPFFERACCSKLWRYFVGFLSCCFLLCNAPNKGLQAKVLKASKFRRWAITSYYATSYFAVNKGYHRDLCLCLVAMELFILFADGFVFCYQYTRKMKKYKDIPFTHLVITKITTHLRQDHPEPGDSDFDERDDDIETEAKMRLLAQTESRVEEVKKVSARINDGIE